MYFYPRVSELRRWHQEILCCGKIPTSVEEGILRMLANRAADPERGCGAFDVSLPVKRVAARFKQEAELQIAYHGMMH